MHDLETGRGAQTRNASLARRTGRFPQLVDLDLRPAKRDENQRVRIAAESGEIEVSQWSRRGRATV
jgi:hypothetical protein